MSEPKSEPVELVPAQPHWDKKTKTWRVGVLHDGVGVIVSSLPNVTSDELWAPFFGGRRRG